MPLRLSKPRLPARPMRSRLAMLALLGVLVLPAQAEIYRWTDAEGRVHYGDNNPGRPDAQAVHPQVNSYKSVTYKLPPTPAAAAPKAELRLYGTSWCGYCKKARRYFESKGIPFRDLDVEKDAAARREFEALGGKGVPVIVRGERRMNGFSEDAIRKLLAD